MARYIVTDEKGAPHGVHKLRRAVRLARQLANGRGTTCAVGVWPGGPRVYTAYPYQWPLPGATARAWLSSVARRCVALWRLCRPMGA